MSERENGDIIKNLDEKADLVYRHGALLESYAMLAKDYGNGFVMTETEAHTLEYVAKLPEATVTHLAEYTYRAKGTISKTLKKLEEKGLIVRRQKPGNRKWIYFELTERGSLANQIHLSYDTLNSLHLIDYLLNEGGCTLEDVESFYKVTAARVRHLEWELRPESSQKKPN